MLSERYIIAANLGYSKVALCVAKVDGEATNVIYYKNAPSDGVQDSRIVHPRRVAISLKNLIQDAESELNIRIRRLVACSW